nr:ATP-binding protein [Candidatus Njordarchaeota archaeon]
MVITKPFEDLGGKFKARLKASQIKERSFMAREGTITLTSVIGLFEANFNIDTLTHLEKPNFIAAKRTDKQGEAYLIYEVTAVKPIHYQMLAMSQGMPKIVRHEYLEKVDQSWEKAEDTWIDIYSVYTGYTMRKQEKDYTFDRNETIVPLEGAESKLLSVDMVDRFINVKGGTSVGIMEGFNRDLLVNLEKLVKYHGAVFGFTGVGKSNLTAVLTRKVLENLPDTKIAVIDVAGEYGIGLADQVAKQGAIYTTENYEAAEDKIDAFLASQAIPETLYDTLKKTQSANALKEYVETIFKTGKVRYLDLEEPTFELILEELEASDRAEPKSLAMDLRNTLEEANISPTSPIGEVLGNKEVHDNIIKAISDCEQTVKGLRYPPEKLLSQLTYITKWIEASTKLKQEEEEKERINPEKVARKLADTKDPERLLITYIPDPTQARHFNIRLLNEVLALRKRRSKGPRILIVIDEAQEFIPDRALRDDLTFQSNTAVERLLRQGRKYMVHGWVSTQRVAHLNVNAVQQIQSFFVGTLPREYDRRVIAEAAGISPDILDKTAYLDMGEWMFVSFRATELRNIPVFIKSENNEDALLTWFSS